MRRIRREEIKPEPYEIVSDALDNSLHMVHRPQFYSKFRAYLFTNFWIIALLFVMATVKCIFSEQEMAAAGGCFIATLGCLTICYWLWSGVKKKVKKEEQRLVFWGFFATGVVVVGKIILILTIILIPLALRIAGESGYVYMEITEGIHAGEYVLVRNKWNGQMEDIYGNTYEP